MGGREGAIRVHIDEVSRLIDGEGGAGGIAEQSTYLVSVGILHNKAGAGGAAAGAASR